MPTSLAEKFSAAISEHYAAISQSTLRSLASKIAKPTEGQIETGNYRKAHIRLHGLDITIENAKGTRRRPGWPTLAAHYGYIKRTMGRDGDHVDVFIGPNVDSELVVVVDQVNQDGRFDEHKCLIGFRNTDEAVATYRKCYTKDWNVGPVTTMTIKQFRAWLDKGDQDQRIAGQVSRFSTSFASSFTEHYAAESCGANADGGGGFQPGNSCGGKASGDVAPAVKFFRPNGKYGKQGLNATQAQQKAEADHQSAIVKIESERDAAFTESEARFEADIAALDAVDDEKREMLEYKAEVAKEARDEKIGEKFGRLEERESDRYEREQDSLSAEFSDYQDQASNRHEMLQDKIVSHYGGKLESLEDAGLRGSAEYQAIENQMESELAKLKTAYDQAMKNINSDDDGLTDWLKQMAAKNTSESYSAFADTFADQMIANVMGLTVEQYAARKAKNSPGQMSLFGDAMGGDTPLRTSATQKRFDWDESKVKRDPEGKFAENESRAGDVDTQAKTEGPKEETAEERRKRLRDYWANLAKEQAKGEDKTGPDPTPEPTPEPTENPAEEPQSEPVDDAPAYDDAKSPRENAEDRQRNLDADYAFARASAIGNAGEDLKGSARHKRNAWQSLEDAESNGTAEQLVTRDQLLKNEPHSLAAHIDRDPLSAIYLHQVMKSFPSKPGYGKVKDGDPAKTRSDYLDAYRSIKEKAESLLKGGADIKECQSAMRKHVDGIIENLRSGGHQNRYNKTANGLISLYNSLGSYRGSIAGKVQSSITAFVASIGDLSPDEKTEKLADAAATFMEGGSLDAALGQSKSSDKGKQFNPAELYVGIAERKGGPKSQVTSAKNATSWMVDKVGIRGVQFGNSVSDAERQHHATMAADALLDLADVTGLPIEAISIGGKLGLAIGARGVGGALAHYEPGTKVINLTRKKGVGSLAHEWAHAFDHDLGGGEAEERNLMSRSHAAYYSEYGGVSYGGKMVDGKWVKENKDDRQKPLYKAIESLRESWQKSGYEDRLRLELREKVSKKEVTSKKASEYWMSRREIFARTFERYVQHKLESSGRKNSYLSGIETKAYKSGGLWPTDSEIERMEPAFESLMDAYREEKLKVTDRVKYSAVDRAALIDMIADRMVAEAMGLTVEQYAARKVKSQAGQKEFEWITVNADKGKGQPVMIDKKDGTIKAGMGGKFNGEKIGEIGKGGDAKGKGDASRGKADPAVVNLPLDKRGSGSIDSQIDKWKDEEAKSASEKRKAESQANKSAKAKAKTLYVTQAATDLVKRTAEKTGKPEKEVRATLESMIKWEPQKALPMLQNEVTKAADGHRESAIQKAMGIVGRTMHVTTPAQAEMQAGNAWHTLNNEQRSQFRGPKDFMSAVGKAFASERSEKHGQEQKAPSPGSEPAPNSPEATPKKGFGDLPHGVQDHVKRHVGVITEANRQIELAKGLDKRFGGGGRYESEVREKFEGSIKTSLENLRKFMGMAEKNGFDGQSIIEGLGGSVESETPEEPKAEANPANDQQPKPDVSNDPFVQSAMEGKIQSASGNNLPGEDSAKSWYEMGKINGYSDGDIKKFYLGRALKAAGKLNASDLKIGFDEAVNAAIARGDAGSKVASAANKAFEAARNQASAAAPSPGSTPAPQPALAPYEQPAIPGQQTSLFGGDDLNTGQKSLFNMARPTKADQRAAKQGMAPPSASMLEQIDDEQRKLADSRKSLPGQRSLIGGDDRDLFMAQFEAAMIERYRVASPSKPKPEKPKTVTGNKGDKGRFITTEDGNVVFIEGTMQPDGLIDTSKAVARKKREKAKHTDPDKFVPVSDEEKAIVDAVGNRKKDVAYFKQFVDEAHAEISGRLRSDADSMRETLAQFGYTGKKLSGFLSSLQRRRGDTSNIAGFDEMLDYAKRHHPQLLQARPGESTAASDEETMLFERLKDGFPPPPKKSDLEVINAAWGMSGIEHSGVPSEWDAQEADADPSEEYDDVPFSASPLAETERYAAAFASAFRGSYRREIAIGKIMEQYAARRVKNSPGQMSLFGDGMGGDTPLRTSARQQNLDWDESKVNRDDEGKFAETASSKNASENKTKAPEAPLPNVSQSDKINDGGGDQRSTDAKPSKEGAKMDSAVTSPTGTKYEVTNGSLRVTSIEGKQAEFELTSIGKRSMVPQVAKNIRQKGLDPSDFTFYGAFIAHNSAVPMIEENIAFANETVAKQKQEKKIAKETAIKSGKTKIETYYRDGEILSGHTVHGTAARLLKELGLAKDVSGWGTLVDPNFVESVGDKFTFDQAKEYAKPEMDRKQADKNKASEAKQAIFDKAKQSGEKQLLSRSTESVDEYDNSLNIIHEYAMPDGTTKRTVTKTH